MSAYDWGRGVTKRIATRDIPGDVKRLVDERQGGRFCVYCKMLDMVTPPTEPMELDHKQPLSKGGDNHHLNLQWACKSHNRSRGDKPVGTKPKVPAWKLRQCRRS